MRFGPSPKIPASGNSTENDPAESQITKYRAFSGKTFDRTYLDGPSCDLILVSQDYIRDRANSARFFHFFA